MTERVDHTKGWEDCSQYQTLESWKHPQGVQVERRFSVYARSEKQAMVASRVCFLFILQQLGFQR